ncbi:MAG: hypothetical protein H6564_06830 [Lewinellaceae bacterium]|nr:hypothetical protein [Lewinellaceae bacterium]
MKKIILSCLLSVMFLSATHAQYDDAVRTGYEGDYFSLEGALDLFKQSYTLRDFERKLNTEENWVNNLDLNYDGRIDYIRVEHRRQGRFHAIVLQALLGRFDAQDVAVIEIEVIGRNEAVLQIIGDEDLYGQEVIVEPVEGYSDSRKGYHSNYGDFVNVYYWEPVQYILGRNYDVYVSPYRWSYYPDWWSPWVQCTWNIFRPRIVVYHRYYHVVHRYRVIHVHNFYRPHRSYSYNVVQHTNTVRVSHGKPPIHRPEPAKQSDGNHSRRDNVVEQPRSNTRPNTPEQKQRTPVSRKSTEPVYKQEEKRNTTPAAGQRSRSSAGSETPRSTTPAQRPTVNSRSGAASTEQKTSRSTAPQVNQPSREIPSRSGTSTRSTTTAPKPSASSRTAPANKPSASRSSAPSTAQPSRSQTSSPSSTSRSNAPASQKSTAPKSTNTKSSSRSRSGN